MKYLKELNLIRVKIQLTPKICYLLKKGTLFSIANLDFKVKNVKEGDKLCCLNCSKRANMSCLPCEHNCFCSLCYAIKNFKSCRRCNRDIKEVLNIMKLKFL